MGEWEQDALGIVAGDGRLSRVDRYSQQAEGRLGKPKLSQQDRAIIRMVADRVARGESLERIARTSRLSYSRIRNLARLARIRYKHRRPTPEQVSLAIDLVRERGKTFRAAAELAQMSRTAVHRLITKLRRDEVDAVGELRVIDGAREYSRNKRSWRCPVHGLIRYWPCVACAAEQKRRGTIAS